MHIRDRIKELRRVRASELKPHPHNWRLHPTEQQEALRGVLAEIGYAGALLARECDDGSLELIDGHLRAEATPGNRVPVLVLDVNEDEARRILATHDPLTSLAETNHPRLAALLDTVSFDSPAVRSMFDRLREDEQDDSACDQPEATIPEGYRLLVECDDEADQQSLYQRLVAEGYVCRVLTV